MSLDDQNNPPLDDAAESLALARGSAVCAFCRGKGEYGGHECRWCDGLGVRFSDVIFRGHPALEGHSTVIEGCCPVLLEIAHEGRLLVFERAVEKDPPFWFVKEHGKQVYRLKPNVQSEPQS